MKECKHCLELFAPRRRNHLYCCNSCKTLASYERNGYKYISGHYQKSIEKDVGKVHSAIPMLPQNDMANLEKKLDKLNKLLKKGGSENSITNAALGNMAGDAALGLAKNIFAPHLLNANKGDIEKLIKEINELKQMLLNNSNGNISFIN